MSLLEASVWDGATPTKMLAILDGAASVRWTDLLADVGSGSCELAALDSKASYCSEGNLVKFSLAGGPVFGYFIESPVLTSGEAAENKWTLAGQSVMSYLGRAVVYPTGGVAAPTGATRTWTGGTFGGVLKTLIDEAQTRLTIPNLTYDFDATYDSAHASWTANVNLTIDCGATLLDVAKKLVALGMGLYMDPQLVLHVYVPGTQGSNLASTVIWRQGAHFRAPVTNTGNRSAMSTVVLVKGAGGAFAERSDAAYTGNPYVGRRESGLDYSSVSGDSTQMNAAGDQQIALSETASQALAVSLTHGTGGLYEPYADYHLGDTVAIDVPGSYTAAPFKIVGLTIAQTPNGDYTVDANLGSIIPSEAQHIKQLIASVGGSSSALGGGVTGNLTLTNPRGFPSGKAFPLNPTTNMAWFRPDLGEWCYYDGTRWLGQVREASYPFGPISATGFITPSGSALALLSGDGISTYIDTVRWNYIVTAPHSGTQYWTNSLNVYDNSGYGTPWSVNTDKTSTTWVDPASTAVGYVAETTWRNAYLFIYKVGTVGNIAGIVTIKYRPIYT